MGATDTTCIGNELFLINMRPLWRRDPQLALQLDAIHDNQRHPLIETRTGDWSVVSHTPEGGELYLHSRYDPKTEAQRFADSIEIDDKYCFVVSGCGLGYHLRALFDRLRGDAFIVCSEPDLRMIATALCCVDLSDAISADRLIFLTDNNKPRLHKRLKDRNALMMLGAQFVQHKPSMRIAETAHRAVYTAIADFASYMRMTLVTLVSNSRITCENIAMNLARYMTTPPIDQLRNRFEGKPGIVVSAGPSLSKNIAQLASLKGKAVICAVQTAIRPLLERDIMPDFVTSLDFHEMSRKFFEDVGDLSSTHLIAEPKAAWQVIDHYPGPVSLLENSWVKSLIGEELGSRDGLKPGATVAHLAFYLAAYLGCDPIIFVGQDLAFSGHVFYIPGVEIHKAWRGEINRFNSMEHKEWDRIARNREILRKVQGNDGGDIYTDELLMTYLEQFENDIATLVPTVINASEGGARIRGTQSMTLAAAAEKYCTDRIEPSRFSYDKRIQLDYGPQLTKTDQELASRIEELDGVVTMCEELLDLFDRLEQLTTKPTEFNRLIVRVDELRTKIQQESRGYQIVNSFTQLAELRRFSADRRINLKDAKDDSDRARQQISRDREFITGVLEGANDLKPILQRSLERVRRTDGHS